MHRLAPLALLALLVAACGDSWVAERIDAEREAYDATSVPAAITTTPTPTTAPPTGTLDTQPPIADSYQPEFEPTDCPMSVSDQMVDRIDCGVLIVPVDRSLPPEDRPNARVSVAILRSASDNPLPDPVIYLHGGPGGNALPDYDQWMFPEHAILDTRDLILIDQRGSGYSEPSLNCTEYDEEFFSDLRALRECFDRLSDAGIDLDRFTTVDIALDVADLRIALGYSQWNVYGISYGTRVALEVMRSAPDGVRSVVLDSPYPPEVAAYDDQAPNGADAIDAVLASCEQTPQCDDAFPDLTSRFDKLLAQLRENPVEVEVQDWSTGDDIDVYVDDEQFTNAIFGLLYDTFALRDVPLAIHQGAQGDVAAAASLLGVGQGFNRSKQDDDYVSLADAEGAHWSPECAEEARFSSADDAEAAADPSDPIEKALLGDVDYAFAVCSVWDVAAAPAATQTTVTSDLPALVVVGQFDPITPPLWADVAIAGLSDGTLVSVPAAGHGSTFERCPKSIMIDFLDEPSETPALGCLDDLEPDFSLR